MFQAAAREAIGLLTALASACILVLLLLLLLAGYERRPCKQTAAGGGSNASTNRVVDSNWNVHETGWWWTASPAKPVSGLNPLLTLGGSNAAFNTPVACSGSGGTVATAANGRSLSSDILGMPGGGEPHSPYAAYAGDASSAGYVPYSTGAVGAQHLQADGGGLFWRSSQRTSVVTQIDGDGPAQVLLADAPLICYWLSTHVPPPSRLIKLLLSLAALALSYILTMLLLDATAFAAVPFAANVTPKARQHVTIVLPFNDQHLGNGTMLNVFNAFEHGLTQVLLSNDASAKAQITVVLTVDSSKPLAQPVRVVNASCAVHDEDKDCAHPLNSAQLNISVSPPASCDERCPLYFLWFRCKCHAAANLTIILPNATNGRLPTGAEVANAANGPARSSEQPARASPTPRARATSHLGFNAFVNVISVSVVSVGTSVRISPVESEDGFGQMLNTVRVASKRGDVIIERIAALGSINATALDGMVRLRGVLGGSVNASGTAAVLEAVVAAQPCFFFFVWIGGDRCSQLPVPSGDAPDKAPMAVLMGELRVRVMDGGLLVANGTMGASDALVQAPAGGVLVFEGAHFLGSLGVQVSGGGVASLANVAALDCALCNAVSAMTTLTWGQLVIGSQANLFCACHLERRGLLFNSTRAKLSAALVVASTFAAHSHSGDLIFDDVGFPPPSFPARNGTVSSLGPPSLDANSSFGNLAINGILAQRAAASSMQVRLSSFAGNIKAVFSGGAISGAYDVVTAPGGFGHVGIVVDNAPTHDVHGILGAGNASVTIDHAYGNVALALSSKAPSAFAGISGGLIHVSAQEYGSYGRSGQPQCGTEFREQAIDDADGTNHARPHYPWLGALSDVLEAVRDSVDEARRDLIKKPVKL